MRELTQNEMVQTNGGILPFIAAVVIVDLALIGFMHGVVEGAEEAAG